MRSKKIMALLLAGAMSMSMLAGCGQDADTKKENSESKLSSVNSEETNVSKENVVSETGVTFPLEKPYEVDVVVCTGVGSTLKFEDTAIYKYMQEKTNVILNVTNLNFEEYGEKVELMLNSGEYPDVFLKAGDYDRYGLDEGIMIPLDGYFEEYAPNYYSLIEDSPEGWQLSTASDGHVYHFESFYAKQPFGGTPFMYINTKWLENLDLEMPHDFESFYEVLKAFKEKDADGDGDPNNEIPWVQAGGDYMPIEDLLPHLGFNSHVFSPWSYVKDNTEVVFTGVTEEYKEFLSMMSKIYAEGLINEDCFTVKSDQVSAMAMSGTSIGVFNAWSPSDIMGAYDSSKSYEENLVTQYEAMTPWDGAKASSGNTHGGQALYITDKCERPEVMVAWADLLYTDEYAMVATYGIEGDTYDIVDGMIKMRDEENPSDTYGTNIKAALMEMNGGLVSLGKQYVNDYNVYYDYEANPYATYTLDISKEWEEAGLKYDPLPTVKVDEKENQRIEDIQADINPYWKEYRAKVVIGEYDLEETWDEYIATMNKMGVQEATKILQEKLDQLLSAQ